MKAAQYTMLDTDLSIAVDKIIGLFEEKKDWQERWDEAENKLKHEMDRAKKPEINHIKGYKFSLAFKEAETKLKIKKPKDPDD